MTLPSLQTFAKPHVNIGLGAVRVVYKLLLTVFAVFMLLPFDASGSSLPDFQTQRTEYSVTNAANPQDSTSQQSHSVTPANPVRGELRGDETKTCTVSLKADQFIKFRVEQHGISLQVTLFDPLGGEVIQMESPAGAYGPILFSAIAAMSGDYRIELKPIDGWALSHPYEIFIDEAREAEQQDQRQVAAERAFSEGGKHWKSHDQASAIRSYQAANDFWEKTKNYHWQAAIQYALSGVYRDSDNVQSETHLKETLRILDIETAPNDWRLKASTLNDLGALYLERGGQNIEKATNFLDQAFTLYHAHDDRRGQASSLNNLAKIQFRNGNLSGARELIYRALELRRAENDQPAINNLTNALGVIADRLGEPDEALKYAEQALEKWEALGPIKASDKRRVASVLNTLATASDKLGQSDQALDYYDRALATYNEKDPLRAVALDSMGELYVVLGNSTKAKECYDKALRILEDTGEPDVDIKAGLLVHLGQLSIASGDVSNGIKKFEEALSLNPPVARQTNILTNLAAALAMDRNYQKAMATYSRTLELQNGRPDQQRGQALTLQKRGEMYALLDRKDEALNDLRSALPLWRAVKDQRGEAATLNAIARVEQTRGNLLSALNSNADAIRIVESLRTNISSHQLRTTYFATHENYYELDVDLKMQLSKIVKRSEYLAAALESSEKARARVLLDALNEAGVGRSIASETSDPRFSSMIEQRLKLLSTLADKAQARTRFLNGPHSAEQIAHLDRELQELSDKSDELQSQIRKQNPKFAKLTKPEPATLRQIQEQLDDDTSLVEYALGEPRSYVWVINRDSIDGVELKPRSEIESYAIRFKEALSARGRNEQDEVPAQKLARVKNAESDRAEASKLLSEAVLAPIASKLTRKRLLIVTDGALQMLPFTALPNPKLIAGATSPTPLMIENHELISLPSASVMVLQRKELAQRKSAPYVVAVIADPVFGKNDERAINASKTKATANRPEKKDANIELTSTVAVSRLTRAIEDVGLGEIRRLPFAGREASAILNIAPSNQSFSAIGFKANRATLNDPKLTQYRMIHLATHGVMDPKNPELSGVLLSMLNEKGKEQNGYVGLSEIYNLNLPADLVVLSACETGTGKLIKGEGLIALTRGFMYAGAARLVASLWKVDDQATALLMASFYKQMLINKLQPAAALREAQRQLAQQKRWSNPHYWAGFVIQGEWR
jgi:CHAT domain-containing protein/lipopolysaccharide biosynthesis regulator YciM